MKYLGPRRQASLGLPSFVFCTGLHMSDSMNMWVFPKLLYFSNKRRKGLKLEWGGLQPSESWFRQNKEDFAFDA